MRELIFVGKVVDQTLRIGGLVSDDAGKPAFVMRIVGVEAFGDKLGMFMVFGKDNGFAQPVAAGDFLARGSLNAPAPYRPCRR